MSIEERRAEEGECGDEELVDWLKPAAVARSSRGIVLIAVLFSHYSISHCWQRTVDNVIVKGNLL